MENSIILEPRQLTTLQGVRFVSAGSKHCAVCTWEGRAYTWGSGANGKLALGGGNNQPEPRLVDRLNHEASTGINCRPIPKNEMWA